MGIVKDAELRKGKAELVRALAAKGVVAQPYERLDALAAKVAGAGGGGDPGGTPERFGNAVLVPPLPGLSVSTLLTPPPTTWNPSDKSADITLSNGNLTATAPAGSWRNVRATRGHSTEKRYFEAIAVTDRSVFIGVATTDSAFSGSVGSDAKSAGYALIHNAIFAWAGAGVYLDGSAALADIVGIAVDFEAKTCKFFRNNVQIGEVSFLDSFLPLFPRVSLSGCGVTARFAAASFTYSPPEGYSAWDS